MKDLVSDVYHRAVDSRDACFDGVFFVAIVSTGVYCRPICPSRRANPANRRFFPEAALAERAGFRPCLRCRPERAPGNALVDSLPRLAMAAAHRIAEGALNLGSVARLGRELGVTERHLRRALSRALGVSPTALKQAHRLRVARQLLVETKFSMARIAFASGFRSVRRFNTAFREHYRTSPTALRSRREAS